MSREKWIDVMKGIGILAVVAGHTYGGISSRIIFLFHMPLFFFIGGYLFKKRADIRSYFRSKVVHLLFPYVIFLSIIYTPSYFPSLDSLSFEDLMIFLIKPLLGGELLMGYAGVFWFVTCFFAVQQVANFMLLRLKEKHIIIMLFVMLGLSYFNAIVFPEFWLPWNLHVALAALPFFFLGYYFKRQKFKVHFALLLGLVALVITSLFYWKNNTYDMKYAEYGIPVVTFLSSLVLILFIKRLSTYVSKSTIISYPLIEFGKASMIIMYLHKPIQLIMDKYFDRIDIVIFMMSIILSYFMYLLFSKFMITRGLLLGSKKDYDQLMELRRNRP